MNYDYDSWALLKDLLEAVVNDLDESLGQNELAMLQTLRSILLLKKSRKFLADFGIAVVALPALSETGKTPGVMAKSEIERFIAEIDTYIACENA